MDENVSINLNEEEVTTLEDIKTSITQDVMDEISQMGYKIIENKNFHKLILPNLSFIYLSLYII